MHKMTLTKLEVARKQLIVAIRLFFCESDPISIETLAGAANGVLRGLAAAKGIQSPIHDTDLIKPEYKKEWISKLHESQNFFKHADRDSDASLDFNPEWIKFVILEACILIRQISQDANSPLLKECILFEIWFANSYPQYLKDPEIFNSFMSQYNIKSANWQDFEIMRMALGIKEGI